jgi:hypothetical protein
MASSYGVLVKAERAQLFAQLVVKLTGCEVRGFPMPLRTCVAGTMARRPVSCAYPTHDRIPSRMGRRTLIHAVRAKRDDV